MGSGDVADGVRALLYTRTLAAGNVLMRKELTKKALEAHVLTAEESAQMLFVLAALLTMAVLAARARFSR